MKLNKIFMSLFMMLFCSLFPSNNLMKEDSFTHSSVKKVNVSSIDSANIVNYDMQSKTTTYEKFDISNYENKSMQYSFANIQSDKYKIEEDVSYATIFGQDNRTKIEDTYECPYSATALVVVTLNENGSPEQYRGTGFLEGPNLLVTAGHCVFDDMTDDGVSNPEFALKIEVYAGCYDKNDCKEDFKYYAIGTKVHIKKEYYLDDNDYNYDWAAVELDRDLGGKVGGHYGKISGGSFLTVGISLFSFGYPSDKGWSMWYVSGVVTSIEKFKFLVNMDTTRGQSGSPIFYEDVNGDVFVCGVFVGESTHENYCILFDYLIFEYLNSFVTDKHMTFLSLNLVGLNGSNWKVKVTNNSTETVCVYYNTKMCFENDAKTWTNLSDINYFYLEKNSSKIVEISKNWFATDIAVSYVFDDCGRFVTYAHDLDKNNTSKMSVYYVLI